MANKSSPKKEMDEDSGCLFVIGAIIISIAIGNLSSAAAGWLTFGFLLMLVAIL